MFSGNNSNKPHQLKVVVDNTKSTAQSDLDAVFNQLQVIDNEMIEVNPLVKTRVVIVEKTNILPFVNFCPDKSKVTRQEMLDKIIIGVEESLVSSTKAIIYTLFWMFLIIIINGLFLIINFF